MMKVDEYRQGTTIILSLRQVEEVT